MWRYHAPTNPGPGPRSRKLCNILYTAEKKIFEFLNNMRINMAARSIVFFVRCYLLLIVGMVRSKAIHGNKT